MKSNVPASPNTTSPTNTVRAASQEPPYPFCHALSRVLGRLTAGLRTMFGLKGKRGSGLLASPKPPSRFGRKKAADNVGEALRILIRFFSPKPLTGTAAASVRTRCTARTSELRPREAAMGFLRPSALGRRRRPAGEATPGRAAGGFFTHRFPRLWGSDPTP